MNCTRVSCGEEATRVMAYEAQGVRCMFVAPYCLEHAEKVEREQHGVPAAGPALSDEAVKIEGVR